MWKSSVLLCREASPILLRLLQRLADTTSLVRNKQLSNHTLPKASPFPDILNFFSSCPAFQWFSTKPTSFLTDRFLSLHAQLFSEAHMHETGNREHVSSRELNTLSFFGYVKPENIVNDSRSHSGCTLATRGHIIFWPLAFLNALLYTKEAFSSQLEPFNFYSRRTFGYNILSWTNAESGEPSTIEFHSKGQWRDICESFILCVHNAHFCISHKKRADIGIPSLFEQR